MPNFNKVILAGNLTRDPQLSHLPSGMACCECGLAINRKWRPQGGGDMREEVCFVDFRAYGKTAEVIDAHTGKGRPLLIEGRLKFDQWEAKDGGKRSKLYVVVDSFQFLGERQEREPSHEPERKSTAERAAASDFSGPDLPPADDGEIPF